MSTCEKRGCSPLPYLLTHDVVFVSTMMIIRDSSDVSDIEYMSKNLYRWECLIVTDTVVDCLCFVSQEMYRLLMRTDSDAHQTIALCSMLLLPPKFNTQSNRWYWLLAHDYQNSSRYGTDTLFPQVVEVPLHDGSATNAGPVAIVTALEHHHDTW